MAHARSAASAAFDFEMPPYTSHTARRSPPRSKAPPPTVAAASPPRSSPSRRSNNSTDNAKHPTGSTTASDRALLDMLRSTVVCLREKRMDIEALGCLEQGLWLQRRMLGAENPQVRAALEEVVLGLNALAMQFLTSAAAFDQCLALLRKAEAITAPGNFSATAAAPLQVLTLNNLGCCYRKLGKPRAALRYLQEAARIGGAIGDAASKTPKEATSVVVNLSVTHLNLCAIQSQLGRHELALEHAQAAIFHAQDELVRLEEGSGTRTARFGDGEREEKLVSLAVAYHNLAVELEFNGRGDASLQWFRKAVELANRYRERNAALCSSFQRALEDAKRKHGPSRPKSASSSGRGTQLHRPRSSRANCDASYQSTVASKCYRPLRPSASSIGANGVSGANSRVSKAPVSSTVATSSGPNARRQRPMSASSSSSRTRRPVSNQLYGSSSTTLFRRNTGVQESKGEPAIERHWDKLERYYELEEDGDHGTEPPQQRTVAPSNTQKPSGSPRRAKQQRRRPQSASAAFSRVRMVENERPVRGHDDDDCGVFDDDEPSDDEQLEDIRCEAHNRRASPSDRRQHGRRHREALNYSQSSSSSALDGGDDEASSGVDGDVSGGYAGEDEGLDLPRQRVSHMAYLRRMKEIAESIRDDIGHSPRARQCDEHARDATMGPSTPKIAGSRDEPAETAETPRSASLSKMRAKLERMRSDSLLSLLDECGGDGRGSPSEMADALAELQHEDQRLESRSHQQTKHEHFGRDDTARIPLAVPPPSDSKPSCVLEEDALVFVTAAQICQGERQLSRSAAARLLQRFYRGAVCRQQLHQSKRLKVESAAARAIQRQVRRHCGQNRRVRDRDNDHDTDSDGGEESREMLLLQQEEIHDIAAGVIQQMYRSRRWSQPPSQQVADIRSEHGRRLESDPSSERAIRRIQNALRHSLARWRVQRTQARRLSRQYIERKHGDVALALAMRKEQAFLEELSAVKIQALVRGHQSRLLTESTLSGLHAAASRIQSLFREYRRSNSMAVSVGAQSIAARVLQRWFRQFRYRCEQEERLDVEEIAAGVIQRCWLQRRRQFGFGGRGTTYDDDQFEEDEYFDDARLEREEAATCIQALSRGHLARKSLQSLSASSSVVSQSSLVAHPDSEMDATSYTPRSTSGNISFLPRRVRELFLRSLGERTAHQFETEEAALKNTAVDSSDERFNELLHELAAAADEDELRRVLVEMRIVVVQGDEDPVAMPAIVRLARILEPQLELEETQGAQGLCGAAAALLFALRGVLVAP